MCIFGIYLLNLCTTHLIHNKSFILYIHIFLLLFSLFLLMVDMLYFLAHYTNHKTICRICPSLPHAQALLCGHKILMLNFNCRHISLAKVEDSTEYTAFICGCQCSKQAGLMEKSRNTFTLGNSDPRA